MTLKPSTSANNPLASNGLIRALIVLAATASIFLVLWFLGESQADPYIRATMGLEGSEETGKQLFRMNCAGCHGIDARGLVGPALQNASLHHSDSALINQIVSGKTPPMPSFEMEPQAMADLLAHLHSLN